MGRSAPGQEDFALKSTSRHANIDFRAVAGYLLALLALLAGCSSGSRAGRGQFPAGSSRETGMYTFDSGRTAFTGRYREALQRMADQDYAGAEAIYRELVEAEPGNRDGYIGLGGSLLMQERYEAARAVYLQAAELVPETAEAWIGLGSASIRCGAFEPAEAAYRRALELDPANSEAHYGLALSLEGLGRVAEAAAELEWIQAHDPGWEWMPVVEEKLERLRE